MTSLYESISKEYSKLAKDTKGFIFFYDQNDKLGHIRYCSDLAQGVSLLNQCSKQPFMGWSGEIEYPTSSWDFVYHCGDNRHYNKWDSIQKTWYAKSRNKITRIGAYPCDDILKELCWRSIKDLCYSFSLPPNQALAKWRLEREKSEEDHLRDKIKELEKQIKRLSVDGDCDNRYVLGVCENTLHLNNLQDNCVF